LFHRDTHNASLQIRKFHLKGLSHEMHLAFDDMYA
jgi:hypothetical protein